MQHHGLLCILPLHLQPGPCMVSGDRACIQNPVQKCLSAVQSTQTVLRASSHAKLAAGTCVAAGACLVAASLNPVLQEPIRRQTCTALQMRLPGCPGCLPHPGRGVCALPDDNCKPSGCEQHCRQAQCAAEEARSSRGAFTQPTWTALAACLSCAWCLRTAAWA